MDEPSKAELDLLLSRGRLKGPAAERVRERVLDAAAPGRRPLWRPLRVALPTAVTFAAVAVGLIVPRLEHGQRSKGGPGSGVVAELACAGGRVDHCPPGARLTIALSGVGDRGLQVGAFAEPEGGGERIWYFSAEDGAAALPDNPGPTALASRSIVVGPEHHPGRYRVHVVLSTRPLRRSEILDPAAADVVYRTVLSLAVGGPEGTKP
jgi:hypothetical protein